MKLILIRHGQTFGNQEHRYVGRTDEGILDCAKHYLSMYRLPMAEKLYVSPMKRCIETARILYPGRRYEAVGDFREMDFGQFEYKNFEQLKDEPAYQKWLDTGGTIPFPDGEESGVFKKRCVNAAKKLIGEALQQSVSSMAWVVHGGTIMAVLEAFSNPNQPFYYWQVQNGGGYSGIVLEKEWKMKRYYIRNIEKIICPPYGDMTGQDSEE